MKIFVSIVCFFILMAGFSVWGQDKPSAHGGNSGIFVFCGKTLPKNFSYRISRKAANEASWKEMAIFSFPVNGNTFQGRLMQQARILPDVVVPDSALQSNLWQKLKITTAVDSLNNWSAHPLVLAAAGAGWWDQTAEKNTKYQYRVERTGTGKTNLPETTDVVSYPGNTPIFSLIPDTLRSDGNSIMLRFYLEKYKDLSGIRVYRTYYQRGEPFSQIRPDIFFNSDDTAHYVSFTDHSVVEGAQYSYYVVPFDWYGNKGKPSDTINVYNKRLNKISPVITSFTGTPDEQANLIRLSWKISNREEIVAVNIYKALSYDGFYTNIATVPPDDTVFLDQNVNPVTTYFYSLVVQTAYGRTFPSARTPVILAGNRPNPFPPMGLEARREADVIRLTWQRTAPDTRGYYIYRGESLTGPLTPTGPVVLSSDSVVTFVDSLKNIPPSAVLVYAVASENTSYAISPLSNRVSVLGKSLRPVPTGLNATLNSSRVQLFWDDMNSQFPTVRGYQINRQEVNEDNMPVASTLKAYRIETPGINSFEDTLVISGRHYIYTIQSLGLSEDEISSPGMPAGIFLPPDLPPAPNHIIALNTSEGVLLQWDLPAGGQWNQIKIYRAPAGGVPELVTILPSQTDTFTDTKVQKGQNYFYWIATVNKEGMEGKLEEPVGIRFR